MKQTFLILFATASLTALTSLTAFPQHLSRSNEPMRAAGSSLRISASAPATATADGFRRLQPRRPSVANLVGRSEAPVRVPMRAGAQAAELPDLVGSVINNTTWTYKDSYDGFYSIGQGTTTRLFGFGDYETANGGGVLLGDMFYFVTYSLFDDSVFANIIGYSVATGNNEVYLACGNDNIAADMTVDPTDGKVYGITYNKAMTGYQLSQLTITRDGSSVKKIADLAGNWNALACDAAGQLYGIKYAGSTTSGNFTVTSSTLCKINKSTGAVTEIGATGQLPQYASSATIDPKSGKMYWNVCPPSGGSMLCEVNLSTGKAVKLFDFATEDEITGLSVSAAKADDKAPAAAANLAFDFTDGSLSGTARFDAPSTTFDGTSASGEISYEILANEVSVATGKTSYGAKAAVPVKLAASGDYTFTVILSNNAGKSPAASASRYVGYAVPEAPAPVLAYSDGTMSLTWNAVTAAVGEGFINPAGITYTVTRYPDNVVAATGLTSTSFSERITEPEVLTDIYYTVTADNGGTLSEPGSSNIVPLGNIAPPYSNSFDLSSSISGFTIIDANNDESTWKFYDHHLRVTFSSNKATDDWFISPPILLRAGKTYEVTIKTWGYSSAEPERIELKWGDAATVAGMKHQLVEPTDVTARSYNPKTLTGHIVPTETGLCYIGIHGISPANRTYLDIDDFSIIEGISAKAPEAPSGLTVTADPSGDLKATVSFTAPSADVSGDPLNSLSRIDVSRGDKVVKSFANPTPGQKLSFTDTPERSGTYTYTVQAFGEYGESLKVSESAYIGVDAPVNPENITLVETANEGEVTIAWDAITRGAHGAALDPSKVTYYVGVNDGLVWQPVTEKSNATSATFRAVPQGEQKFVQYAVFAETEGGSSAAVSPSVAVGHPYSSVAESFPEGMPAFEWLNSFVENEGEWGMCTDDYWLDFASQDADNGYAAMEGVRSGSSAALLSGKIRLGEMKSPGMTLYSWNIVPEDKVADLNEIEVYVNELGSETWKSLGKFVVSELGNRGPGWQPIFVSLDGYTGKTIQLRIQATARNYIMTLLDNVFIGNVPAIDIVAREVTAPAKVECGSDYTVNVIVANEGIVPVENVTVSLSADGTVVGTKTVSRLEAGATTLVDFVRTMDVFAEDAVVYSAEATVADDEIPANNKTTDLAVAPSPSRLPGVQNLKAGIAAEGGVSLSWTAPAIDNAPGIPATESFEEGGSFAHNFADWTFVDVDQYPVGTFTGAAIPGIESGKTLASFFVFDAGVEPFSMNYTFDAASGMKYLASLFRYDDGPIDDWAISPLLDGYSNTVTFRAKSYSDQYPEKVEVYVSYSGKDMADFEKMMTIDAVPGEWTDYSFEVGDGARYFALRSCATGGFMLMVDDVNFVAGSSTSNLKLLGYDIYRDGLLINEEARSLATAFTDAVTLDGRHSYAVVAAYANGKSAPAYLDFDFAGLDAALYATPTVAGGNGFIAVTGAAGHRVAVIAPDGRTLYSGDGADRMTIPAPHGIYIVTVGPHTAKAAVR